MRTRLSPCLQLEELEPRLALSTFFVDPNGDDGQAGTQQAPWQTLQHAADLVQPGDMVIVQAGRYAGFDMRTSGTAAAPITFHADPGVQIVSPESQRNDGIHGDGINIENYDGPVSYVVIEGFTIRGMDEAGIRSAGTADAHNDHITIRSNTTDQNGVWGIFTAFTDNLLIESNVASRSVQQHGIYVSNSSDSPVIRLNTIWGNHDAGIHMNGDLSQGGNGLITNALVERNIIYDNGLGGGAAINMDGVQNSTIQNNLLYNNHASGITLFQNDGAEPSTNNVVANNTVVMASGSRSALLIADGSTGNTVVNNILLTGHSGRGSINISADSLLGFTSDHNVVDDIFTVDDGDTILDLPAWNLLTGQDAHSLVATTDQLFVGAANGDYHLLATSPAIGAGTSQNAPLVDLDGNPRGVGGDWDIGAYQYVG
jgi:hypothetical protein